MTTGTRRDEKAGLRRDLIDQERGAAAKAQESAARINDLRHYLDWALDIIDMYDQRVVALGDPPELVNSEVHLRCKSAARAALANGEKENG